MNFDWKLDGGAFFDSVEKNSAQSICDLESGIQRFPVDRRINRSSREDFQSRKKGDKGSKSPHKLVFTSDQKSKKGRKEENVIPSKVTSTELEDLIRELKIPRLPEKS